MKIQSSVNNTPLNVVILLKNIVRRITFTFFSNTSSATENWLTLNCDVSYTFCKQLIKLKHF